MAVATLIPPDPCADPQSRAAAPARRARALGGTLALVASLCAHGLMAAAVGVTLSSLGARERPPATGVEIEIAAAPAPVLLNAPASAPRAAPVSARRAARQIEAARMALAAPPRAAVSPAPAAPEVVQDPPAIPPPVSQAPAPARFAMSAGTVAGRAAAPGPALASPGRSSLRSSPGPWASAASGGGAADPVLDAAAVDVPATLVAHPPALYPPAARRAEVEGDVAVEIVVDADGVVSRASVLSDRGYGLDAAALQAVRAYRFSPARRAGRPVRVRMRWTVQFRLH